MKPRFLFGAITIALTAAGLAACTPDPMNVTCEEYLGRSESEQLDLAARWGSPTRDSVDEMSKMVAPQYRKDLLDYCRTHSDDKLKDLHLTLR